VNGAEILATIAQLAVAVTGFSGIATAFVDPISQRVSVRLNFVCPAGQQWHHVHAAIQVTGDREGAGYWS
jgi:hypothetical protein